MNASPHDIFLKPATNRSLQLVSKVLDELKARNLDVMSPGTMLLYLPLLLVQ